jgi:predicted ester cyclase
MDEENKQITLRWIDEMCGQRNLGVGDEIFAADLIDHNPAPDQAQGPEGQKQVLRELWEAFPDFHTQADDVIAQGDRVVVRWSASGTHEGSYYGIAPTGKKITYSGIDIVRIERGKIVERWGFSDDLGLLQQLEVK